MTHASRWWKPPRAGLIAAIALACSDPTVPPAHPDPRLVGTWISAPVDHSPQGWLQWRLTFSADGFYTDEVRSRGIYAGQTRNQLSAFSRTEGRHRVENGRLIITRERLVWWDSFYGAGSRVKVESPHPYADGFEDPSYELTGDRLTIHDWCAPLDVPVPCPRTYQRGDWPPLDD